MFGEWREKEKAQENAKKMTEKKEKKKTLNKIKTGNTGAEKERKDTVNIHRRT